MIQDTNISNLFYNVIATHHNITISFSYKYLVKVLSPQRKRHMSHGMGFPKKWYVRPAKAQTSLRIRAVWSKHLLVAWIFYEC